MMFMALVRIIVPVHKWHFNNDAERWECQKQMMISFGLLIVMLMLAVFVWAYFQVMDQEQTHLGRLLHFRSLC